MGGLSLWHWIIVALVILVLFGRGKISEMMGDFGKKKQVVCNRTNAEAIRLMLGRDTDQWIGKRITLSGVKMKDPFGDGEVCAIRVVGSPDIDKPMSAEVKRGRKTLNIKVRPTGRPGAKPNGGNGKAAGAAQTPAPSSPPPPAQTEMSDEEKAEILARENAQAGENPF